MAKKNTGEELAKHVGAAAAGAFGGVFLGKFGVPASIATIAYGVYKDEPLAITSGSAMMTGGAVAGMRVQTGTARMGNQSFVDEGKDNVKGFVKGLATGLFLDKIPAVKERLDLGSIGASMLIPETDPAIMAQLQQQASEMEGLTMDRIEGMGSVGTGFDEI